jgi:gluconolactonase
LTEHLKPSGSTGSNPGNSDQGSNGLTLDNEGHLLICQHGNRQIARVKRRTQGQFEALATNFQGKRFNSPNDLALRSNGDLYFTDPPYGLPQGAEDPRRELKLQGVYRVSQRGRITLLVRELTRPNGIAFAPDEKRLYVAVSDPERAHLMAYDVKDDGTLAAGRIFFDATPLVAGRKGLPDGLKVDTRGNVWATGPGGVLVLSPEGRHLGTINPGVATANCAWGGDGSVLYLTADSYLCRVQTKTRGAIPGPMSERR